MNSSSFRSASRTYRDRSITGGVQPLNLHHSFRYRPAKAGMRLLSDSRVGTVVIVGPFHFSRGFMLWNDRFNLDVASLWRCEYYLSWGRANTVTSLRAFAPLCGIWGQTLKAWP